MEKLKLALCPGATAIKKKFPPDRFAVHEHGDISLSLIHRHLNELAHKRNGCNSCLSASERFRTRCVCISNPWIQRPIISCSLCARWFRTLVVFNFGQSPKYSVQPNLDTNPPYTTVAMKITYSLSCQSPKLTTTSTVELLAKHHHSKNFIKRNSATRKIFFIRMRNFLTFRQIYSQTQEAKMESSEDTVPWITDDGDRSGNIPADPKEITAFKSTVGKMLFIGRLTHPVMVRGASIMATKPCKLQLHHLKDLESELRYLKKNPPKLLFNNFNISQESTGTSSKTSPLYLDVYTDALLYRKCGDNPREGFIIFRRYQDIVHPIYWISRKIRRAARSSATAETIAASDAMDSALYLRALLI